MTIKTHMCDFLTKFSSLSPPFLGVVFFYWVQSDFIEFYWAKMNPKKGGVCPPFFLPFWGSFFFIFIEHSHSGNKILLSQNDPQKGRSFSSLSPPFLGVVFFYWIQSQSEINFIEQKRPPKREEFLLPFSSLFGGLFGLNKILLNSKKTQNSQNSPPFLLPFSSLFGGRFFYWVQSDFIEFY